MRTTRVPEIFDRLLEVLGQRIDSETTQILDGPTSSGDYKESVLLFGYRPDAREDVTVTRTGPDGLEHNDREFFTIGWLINSVDSTGSVSGARSKTAAVFAVLEGVLTTNDQMLGIGDGVKVRLGDHSWRAIPTPKGIEQTVSGLIVGEALL